MKIKSTYILAGVISSTVIMLAGCGAADDGGDEPSSLGTPIYQTEDAIDEVLNTADDEAENGEEGEINSKNEITDNTEGDDGAASEETDQSLINGTANNEVQNKEVQFAVIAAEYENCKREFLEQVGGQSPAFTIADFNHNGRLEIIISDCQGSGAFSTTAFYEVSEDYTTLEKLPAIGDKQYDYFGDFLNCTEFVCYRLDDTYYYVVEDFTSSGWDCKGITYYLYSFDDKVEVSDMGGFVLLGSLDSENKCVYEVKMYDIGSKLCRSEEDYLAGKIEYLQDYKKMPTCKVTWMQMTEDIALSDKLQVAYAGYNPEYGNAEVNYSYTKVFGEDIEYKVN
ncbi:MAG: hypothetical protein MJ130_04205 [Lachnospiraceae bacterium]|nr:hypothetical protein [Lachnospiraceae bacterium]